MLQNGEVIEENSDEMDNITESMASEHASLQESPTLKPSEVQALSTNMCQSIIYDLVNLVVEAVVEEERQYEKRRSLAVVALSDMSDRDLSKAEDVSPLQGPGDPKDRKTSEQAVA